MALASLPILIPLFAAAVLAGTSPLSGRVLADALALAAALASLVMCALLVHRAGSHELAYWWGDWQPRHGVALGIAFAFGSLGAGFAAFVAALTIAALLASWHLREIVGHLYHAVLLVFMAAMIGFCLSGDLFTLFVFFELMGVAAYVLAGFMIGARSPLEGALNFAITNSVGAIVLLLGVALVYGRTGALNLAQIGVALD